MNPKIHRAAVTRHGSVANFAKKLGVSRQLVYYWMGTHFPAERCRATAELLQIHLFDLRPDLWNAPDMNPNGMSDREVTQELDDALLKARERGHAGDFERLLRAAENAVRAMKRYEEEKWSQKSHERNW